MRKTFQEHQDLCVVIHRNENIERDRIDYIFYYTNQTLFLNLEPDEEIELFETTRVIRNNEMFIDLTDPLIVSSGIRSDFNMFI